MGPPVNVIDVMELGKYLNSSAQASNVPIVTDQAEVNPEGSASCSNKITRQKSFHISEQIIAPFFYAIIQS